MSESATSRRRPPRARDYAALVLGVWVFFAGLAWTMTVMLRLRGGEDVPGAASRGIVAFFLILGATFAMVALFDLAWLTFRRPDAAPDSAKSSSSPSPASSDPATAVSDDAGASSSPDRASGNSDAQGNA